MTDGQPRILFLGLSGDIGSERVPSEMARRGARCAVMARPGSIAMRPAGLAYRFDLPARGGPLMAAFGLARRLGDAAEVFGADAVVPLDESAAATLRDIALEPHTSSRLRALLRRSLGDPAHYRTAGCRDLLIETARALGIRVPAQGRAEDVAEARAAAAALGYPLMLKREATCGGAGVSLVGTEAALVEAFGREARRARAKRSARRLFGAPPVGRSSPITLQAHVAGQLVLRTVACQDGRTLAGLTLKAERLNPPVTGSSTVVRPLDHPDIAAAASCLVAALRCSGFVSFDFILKPDGTAFLIEMNARPVGSGHLGALFGCDVYGAWLAQFPGFDDAAPPLRAPLAGRAVALFPKEMMRDPDSPDLAPDAGIHHDIPWDEPDVVAHYGALLTARHPRSADDIARRLRLARAPVRAAGRIAWPALAHLVRSRP